MKVAMYNPYNKPIEELPSIYGFNNGERPDGWFNGQLVTEDGTAIGDKICATESFMYQELGIDKGSVLERHENFKEHYPDGYKMEFVPRDKVKSHDKLMKAINIVMERQDNDN